MENNFCYIEYNPSKTQLNTAFSEAIRPSIQESRDGYMRVVGTVARVKLMADTHKQAGLKITAGSVLSR